VTHPQWAAQIDEAVLDKDQEAPPPLDEVPKKGLWGKVEALNLHVYFIAIAWMCLCTHINILVVLTSSPTTSRPWRTTSSASNACRWSRRCAELT